MLLFTLLDSVRRLLRLVSSQWRRSSCSPPRMIATQDPFISVRLLVPRQLALFDQLMVPGITSLPLSWSHVFAWIAGSCRSEVIIRCWGALTAACVLT